VSLEKEPWVPELLTAAAPHGLDGSLGSWLHRTAEIVEAAREMEALMPKPLRLYLTANSLLNHPDLIEDAANMRARRK